MILRASVAPFRDILLYGQWMCLPKLMASNSYPASLLKLIKKTTISDPILKQ